MGAIMSAAPEFELDEKCNYPVPPARGLDG